MKLYHGTSTKHLESIKTEGFKSGTWFAQNDWHALQLAERTAKRDGGSPIIIGLELIPTNRIMGREKPSYRYAGEAYCLTDVGKLVYAPIA